MATLELEEIILPTHVSYSCEEEHIGPGLTLIRIHVLDSSKMMDNPDMPPQEIRLAVEKDYSNSLPRLLPKMLRQLGYTVEQYTRESEEVDA